MYLEPKPSRIHVYNPSALHPDVQTDGAFSDHDMLVTITGHCECLLNFKNICREFFDVDLPVDSGVYEKDKLYSEGEDGVRSEEAKKA